MQINVCSEKLKSLGLKVRRLKTKEIVNSFYSYITNGKEKDFNLEKIDIIGNRLSNQEKQFLKRNKSNTN